MACDCYEKTNEALGEHNTRITSYFTFESNRVRRPWPIETTQIEKGRGKKKAMGLFASFCPLCGACLRSDDADLEEEHE